MIKEIVNKAYNYAKSKHEGQMRKYSDLPYFSHPKAVARIIEELTGDPEMIASALLHDVVEDSDSTIEEINKEFGNRVADLVNELTNKKEERGSMTKRDYMIVKLKAMSHDALLIKLADRYHNIQYLRKDCKITKELAFIKYYYKNTLYILDNLNIGMLRTLEIPHLLLYRKIWVKLDYLKYVYKF